MTFVYDFFCLIQNWYNFHFIILHILSGHRQFICSISIYNYLRIKLKEFWVTKSKAKVTWCYGDKSINRRHWALYWMLVISTGQKMTNPTFSDNKVKGQGQGHCRGQNHIFGNNFACNEDRNMKLTPFCSSTQGLSDVCHPIWRFVKECTSKWRRKMT